MPLISFDQFISKYLGKKVDWDLAYQGQCTDLFRQYVNDCLGFPQPKGVIGAADFWTNYPTDSALNKKFNRLINTPNSVPQKGDVMLWDKDAGGGFGHVAMFIDGDVNGFTSLDQNWPTLSKVTKTKHDYNNVYGWLRPIGVINMPDKTYTEAEMTAVRLERDKNWDLYQKEVQLHDQTKTVLKLAEGRVDVAYQNGFKAGKESVPASQPGSIDLSKYEENGLTVEVTDGNHKFITNYKRKQ